MADAESAVERTGAAAMAAADAEGFGMMGASGERERIGRPDALSTRGGSNPSRPASPSHAHYASARRSVALTGYATFGIVTE